MSDRDNGEKQGVRRHIDTMTQQIKKHQPHLSGEQANRKAREAFARLDRRGKTKNT